MVDSSIFWLRMAAFLYAVGLLHSMLAILRRGTDFYPFALGTFRVGVVLHGVAIIKLAGAYGRLTVESFYGTLSPVCLPDRCCFCSWTDAIFASASAALFPLVLMTLVAGTGGRSAWSDGRCARLADRAHFGTGGLRHCC